MRLQRFGRIGTIPIIFSIGGDAVKLGLVSSFNRPVTGTSFLVNTLGAKRPELLRELVPSAAVIGLSCQPEKSVFRVRDRDLGGLEKLQSDLNAGGLRVSGDGKLALETRPNQDSVLMDGKRVFVRQRRVGACLLPPLSKSTRRLFEGMVECRELECTE